MQAEVDLRRILLSCATVGLVVGIIGAIPVVRLPNLCCLWVIAGGFTCAYLSLRNTKGVETVDGAIIGAIFGFMYGILNQAVLFLINTLFTLLGLGLDVRGVAFGGLSGVLDLHIGGVLWGLLLIILTTLESVLFGAVGGALYAVVANSEDIPDPRRGKIRKS